MSIAPAATSPNWVTRLIVDERRGGDPVAGVLHDAYTPAQLLRTPPPTGVVIYREGACLARVAVRYALTAQLCDLWKQ